MKTIKAEHRQRFLLILAMTEPPEDRYLSSTQAAAALGVKPNTVAHWVWRGKLVPMDVDRHRNHFFSAYDVAIFLMGRR